MKQVVAPAIVTSSQPSSLPPIQGQAPRALELPPLPSGFAAESGLPRQAIADPLDFLTSAKKDALAALPSEAAGWIYDAARIQIESRFDRGERTREIHGEFMRMIQTADELRDPRLTAHVVDLAARDRFFLGGLITQSTWSPCDGGFTAEQRRALLRAGDDVDTALLLALLSFDEPERCELFSSMSSSNRCFARLTSVEELLALNDCPQAVRFKLPLSALPASFRDGGDGTSMRRLLDLRHEIGHASWLLLFWSVGGGGYADASDAHLAFYGRLCAESHPFRTALLLTGEGVERLNRMEPEFLAQLEAVLGDPRPHLDSAMSVLASCGIEVDEKTKAIVEQVAAGVAPAELDHNGKYRLLELALRYLALSRAADRSELAPDDFFSAIARNISFGGGTYGLDPLDLGDSTRAARTVEILKQRESTWREILESPAVAGKTYDVKRILMGGDLDQTLDLLVRSLTNLSSDQSEAERLATITGIAMAASKAAGISAIAKGVLVDAGDRSMPIESIEPSLMHRLFTAAFAGALELRPEQLDAANARNRGLTRLLSARGANFPFPEGSLIHALSAGVLGDVLRSANLAGDAVGSATATDAIPGFVDLQATDPSWTSGKLAELYGQGRAINKSALLVYDPKSVEKPLASVITEYPGHRLALGALTNAALMCVVVEDATSGHVEEAKRAAIERGLYVPIISAAGKLLFTWDEFAARSASYKKFDDLEALLASTDVYTEYHRTTPDPGGLESIADHCESVRRNCSLFSSGAPPELRRITEIAAKLHDLGKRAGSTQEIDNVEAADEILRSVRQRDREAERKILLLIKYDELLGEILKNVHSDPKGGYAVSEYAASKLAQLARVFTTEEMRTALQVLYEADVSAKGRHEEWEVAEKLAFLGMRSMV